MKSHIILTAWVGNLGWKWYNNMLTDYYHVYPKQTNQ